MKTSTDNDDDEIDEMNSIIYEKKNYNNCLNSFHTTAQVDQSFASMLLKYVNKLKEIDKIKEEERAMVRVGEDIYGAVVPSDGGKTGAGSCVYILTEKVEKEPTMEEDLRRP